MSTTTSIWAPSPRMRLDTKQMVIEISRLESEGKRKTVGYVDVVHTALEYELKRVRKKHGVEI